MLPAPITRGSDATSDNVNIIGPNDRYVASDPQAVDPHIICRWCHFQVRFGRGPIEFVPQCHVCQCEMAQLSEVQP